MRARNRHSASNYLFAAFLELVIMGLFVVIAQPQLREALFELLEPSAKAIAVPQAPQIQSAAVVGDALIPGSVHVPVGANVPSSAHAPSSAGLPAAANGGWSMAAAGYSPLEQFESFTVSTVGNAATESASSFAAQDNSGERRVAGYAPSVGATQLRAIDWNIASAAQSPRPVTGAYSSGWTASRPVEADYRDTYPPPYGTQDQWK